MPSAGAREVPQVLRYYGGAFRRAGEPETK
jgi:hypothetical protein